MKKIHTIVGALLLSSFAFAQSSILLQQTNKNSSEEIVIKKKMNSNSTKKVAAGVIKQRCDVGFSILAFNTQADFTTGLTNTVNIGTYIAPVNVDSTVRYSLTSGTKYVSTTKQGVTFDPQSIIYDPSYVPLFANNDTYYLDTVWIGGIYKRVSAPSVVDTLLVEIVYGDTTVTSAFSSTGYASATTYSNVASFGTFLSPNFSPSSLSGNTCFLSAPASNYKKIKVPLTQADSATLNQTSYLPVVVNGITGLMLSGSNKVSVAYSFISGAPTTTATVFYTGGTPVDPQTSNGFAGICYQQKAPAISNYASIQNYFDDPIKGKNIGIDLGTKSRYGMAGSSLTKMYANFYTSYWVDFSIHGVSSVGINELEANGATLGQNVPNPFNGESTVTYQLAKDANSILFTVTDVMGRVISSEKAATSTGSHSIKLGSYAAGVYYYTLNVDGKTSTKKMIAQ
jgi:hypothetical protein